MLGRILMSSDEQRFTIFYSWQSDLPTAATTRAIRKALKVAARGIEEKQTDLTIVLDEATRNEPGSPNIPATILRKIDEADLFLCDISTINASAPDSFRRTPNPNVVFELGYAVASLGWSRVVMLFNEAYGSFPSDLPFDFDSHRASPYTLEEDAVNDRQKLSSLSSLIRVAIEAVHINKPARPSEAKGPTTAAIKRFRDLKNLRWILSQIHFPTVDEMIDELPDFIEGRAIHFWEGFNAVAASSLFHIYDSELRSLLECVRVEWDECVSHGGSYRSLVSGDRYAFGLPNHMSFSKEEERTYTSIETARAELRKSIDALLDKIRLEYVEVDLDDLNRKAWTEYCNFMKELEV